jgi:hypothetical protein
MAGFDVPSSKQVYSIPNSYEAVEAIARLLYGKCRKIVATRTISARKSLEQFFFSGSWNQTSSFVKKEIRWKVI